MAGVEEITMKRQNGTRLEKFQHPDITADGSNRASVTLTKLETLWINTGTLCNIECSHCYIESSPTNDRLVYLSNEEVTPFLDEALTMGAREIGFTGGEPFLNPDILKMLQSALSHGFTVLVLTNAMRPMMRPNIKTELLTLQKKFGQQLQFRISLDHYLSERHDEERGTGAFEKALNGIIWLSTHGFALSIAGRTLWQENEESIRKGFATMFAKNKLSLDAHDPTDLILFPEMDEHAPVPEITTECWDILQVDPKQMMCASARMVVKYKGAKIPTVLACTLLAYDKNFEQGSTLKQATGPVKLNHPHCAKFCVLGGASCSGSTP